MAQTLKKTKVGAACACVITVAASAVAACPVASDLENGGVRFIGPDGTDEVHVRISPHQVQMDLIEQGVPGTYRAIMIQGVYIQWLGATTDDGAIDAASIFVMARDIDPAEMPTPEPGLEWQVAQDFIDVGGDGSAASETMAITVAEATTWTLGECTYDMYPVTISTTVPDDVYIETINYLPALGTGVLVAYRDSQTDDTYPYVDIAVEAQ